jgi:hypothetical protein
MYRLGLVVIMQETEVHVHTWVPKFKGDTSKGTKLFGQILRHSVIRVYAGR